MLLLKLSEHTHTQPFNNQWSATTRVGRYQKKHSPTHTHPGLRTSFINFLHLPTIHGILCVQFTFLAVLFDNLSPGPLWSPFWSWTLYFILHAFLHLVIIFCSTCPYHHSLFCCNTNAVSSIPSLSLSSLLGNQSFSLMPHIHLTILISAR